ncbi:hypothetical protein [Falsiroseomonas sp. CW058]|uniref:hypothetical protein n=1 Tax=Falsiroseomonas sp. CW058 TaxID=3388664 RepID=UPI003D321E2F
MRISCRRAGALALAAMVAGTAPGAAPSAASIGTPEYTQFLPVWLTPGPGMADHPVPALLNLPPGWQPGDAAAVIAKGPDMPDGLRHRLTAAMLDAGAAVVEIHVLDAGLAELPATLVDALATLRVGFGAGLVVAIGAGGTAAAVLDAVHSAAHGGFTAAAVPEGAAPRLAAGRPPPAVEAWPSRAPLLCDVLASALATRGEGFAADCSRTLLARP